MENASKALIIAGAILLSILLISLGIMIFNQGSEVVNNGGMTEAELQSFNTKMTKYEGSKTGTIVKSMVNEVLAVNKDNLDRGSAVRIQLNGKDVTDDVTTKNVKANSIYSVEAKYTGSRVTNMVVKDASNNDVDFGLDSSGGSGGSGD